MENSEGDNLQNIPNPKAEDLEELQRPLTKKEKRLLAREKKKKEFHKNERRERFKKFFLQALILLALLGGGFKIWQWIRTPEETNNIADVLEVKDDDWVKGSGDAKVTLIEYADFECPACAIYFTEVIPKLIQDYKDNLKIVYRHFPLPQHNVAIEAAKAAEAAGMQGKFWEMGEILYKNQKELEKGNYRGKFTEYAENLGLDIAQFEDDFKSDQVLQSIKDNEKEAYTLKIKETPTFFVNGKKVVLRGNGYEDLKKAIDQFLQGSDEK